MSAEPSAPPEVRSERVKVRKVERCYPSRAAVPYYRALTHTWQALRGSLRLAGPGPRVRGRSCSWARYAASEWRARSIAARETYFRWKRERTLYDDGDWKRAVREAQRPYPGTEGWLLSCSASEGGWGRWVPNSQGSGVGGWLQFMPGTFTRMWTAAHADVRERGFIVPRSAHSWYSALGQALAGAWGVTNGRRGEWYGSGC